MVKFTEVYQKQGSSDYSLRDITINPQHVVAFREDPITTNALNENRLPTGLSKSVGFTRIFLNSGQFSLNVVVAGSPEMVEQKFTTSKKLLKG
jgi:hypothetical protein